ncbi:MAG: hypothetical protein V4717_09805 [Bacteroidota bacterium]
MYLLRLFSVSNFVFKFFKIQRQYNDQFIDAYLQPFYNEYGHSIKDSALQKIKKYYCLGIPVTCASYKKIYGKDLSDKERELATLTGIITPLIDDFTDEKTLSDESIEALTSYPETYQPATVEEAIVKNILCTLIKQVPDPKGFLYALNRTIKAQHLSVRQMDPGVTEAELLHITLEKGAWSHIFFHYIIDEIPVEATIGAMDNIGGMLQMSNDIFDVYKDYKEGIRTIPNTCKDYLVFEKYYLSECKKFCAMARALPYPKKDLEFFITFIAFVMARGIVALKMLQKLQHALGGGALPIASIKRKQLICDMEKPINALKTARYTLRIVKP